MAIRAAVTAPYPIIDVVQRIFRLAMYPTIQKPMKLDVTPAIKLNNGFPFKIISLRNIPKPAPNPPTQGPKTAAKIAGITA